PPRRRIRTGRQWNGSMTGTVVSLSLARSWNFRPDYGTGKMETETPAPRSGGDDRLAGLIEAVASRRDRVAFAELFRHFAPRLKSFVMRAGIAPDQAEELAQEAMVAVWRRAETFDRRRAAASTWVFTIARNKRIDSLRRGHRADIDPQSYEQTLREAA